MLGLNQTATVYTPNGTTGAYTVVAQASLPVRLVAPGAGTMNPERSEAAPVSRLLWGPDYTTMPETAQLAIAGVRWNVKAGTVTPVRWIDSVIIYHRCEVERAL